jgi:hypothetical protein
VGTAGADAVIANPDFATGNRINAEIDAFGAAISNVSRPHFGIFEGANPAADFAFAFVNHPGHLSSPQLKQV